MPFALGQTTTATTITATPAVLSYTYQLGTTTLPAAQNVALKSTTANLTASLSVTGDLPSNGDWVTTSIRPGTSFKLPSSITVTVTPTGLAAGNYSAVITATASTASGTVQRTIAITLTIAPPASTLHFSPPALPAFTYTTGGTPPASQQFLMYSDGSPMSVTVSVASAPWLKLNPTGSIQMVGLTRPIVVSIDSTELAKLAPKTYTANITVAAPTATNKSSTYPVTLTVSAATPQVTDTWPDGVVMNTAGTGVTTVLMNGASFFSSSTVAVSGFTSSTVVKVNDTAATPLAASETISIPVYSATASGVRLTLGSPLPAAHAGQPYTVDLSPFVAGGTGPYYWTATGLPDGFSVTTAGLLTCVSPVTGTYTLQVAVLDLNGARAYAPLSLTVYPAAAPPVGTVWLTVPSVLPAAIVGSAYTANLAAVGGTGTYTWSLDSTTPLPVGLSIGGSGTPVVISGNPTSVGTTGSVVSKLLSDGAIQVSIPNTYLTKLGVLRMAITTPAPGGGTSNEAQLLVYGPEPRVLAVSNSASYASGSVAPGELITIFGTGLGPSTLAIYDPNSTTLPQLLPSPAPPTGATGVSFVAGGVSYPAALLYAGSGQIGAMVPFELAGAASVQMNVAYGGLTSKSYPLNVSTAVPGIFTMDGSGRGQGAILNYVAASGDYILNSNANAASKGSIVVLYITGFGVTNPASSSVLWAGTGVDSAVAVSVTIDGKAATVVAMIPPGSFPGVLQINATVPSDASAGKAIPVAVSVGGISAQTGVTMAVK